MTQKTPEPATERMIERTIHNLDAVFFTQAIA